MGNRLRSVLGALLRRRRFEDDLAEEVRFHLEEYTAELVRSGLPPEEAARRARREFGNVLNVKEGCREARGLRFFDELRQDLRQAFRLLARTPGFTATALATLALCLGANLTIFAVVDAVLLRPLPFPDAGRLVSVYNTYPKAGVLDDGCSLPNYYERRGRIPAFQALAAWRERTAVVGEAGATEREPVLRVTPDFFATLGRGPVLGRAFGEKETAPGADAVVILGDSWWRRHLGGDPGVLGKKIRIDGIATTVVGVLPPDFAFLSSPARLYLPLVSTAADRAPALRHSGSSQRMIARLAPGATMERAQVEIDARNAALVTGSAEDRTMAEAGFRSLVVPLHASHVAAIRPTLLLLQAGALFLLLIGAVNLVNLFLIRAGSRVRELAVRQAIGAIRRHVVSEVMVETVLLTLAGGLLGLAVGAAGIRLLAALGTDRLPLGARIVFDTRLALVAVVGAVITGIAIGLPVACYNLRGQLAGALKSESRGATAGRAAQGVRHAFLVGQISLSFVLLAGTGLLASSLHRLTAVSPGFRPQDVLSAQIVLSGRSYPGEGALLAFTERLLERLEREPGVVAAGVLTNVPLSGRSAKSAVRVKGQVLDTGKPLRGHYAYSVGGDGLAALGIPLREGRFLTAADSRRPERFCVVDEDFARHYWPRGGALGRRLFEGGEVRSDAEAYTVVGVVGRVKQAGLTDEGQGAVFYPFGHRPDGELFVVARTTLPPETLAAGLRRIVRRLDSELPVTDLRSMEERLAASLVPSRSAALLAGLFSGLALLLTAIGTYGVLSHAVARRRREIALRLALGARPRQVRRELLALVGTLFAAGLPAGLFGAWITGRAMQSLLFQVPPFDPRILAGTAALLGAVALVACLPPSQRAARISPMAVLVEE